MTIEPSIPTGDTNRAPSGESAWRQAIALYQQPDRKRGILQLVDSLLPFALLWAAAYALLRISPWMSLGCSLLAALFLVRIFIISHDCGHGSFFRSRKANDFWGRITSFLALLPYTAWRHSHAIHHAHSGDLDNRGAGDITTWTVREYRERSRRARLGYRLYRHPLVLFTVGPIFVFLIANRFWPRGSSSRVKWSVVKTNFALLGVLLLARFTIGIQDFFLVQGPITLIAGILGVWLFYVQHQFEGVYWRRHAEWNFLDQAMQGSSYYKLPKPLQWFSGNIGFHHIHHLGARIPNYFLSKAQREIDLFKTVKPLTLRASLKCLKFRLWDEKNHRLVGFDPSGPSASAS